MSGKTVADKLLIKAGGVVWLSHPDRVGLLGPLPADVAIVEQPDARTVAVVFGGDAASLRQVLADHADALAIAGTLWIAYPKGNRVDINRESVWPMLTPYGLRPIAQIAVDEVWSALRFRPLKPGEEPFNPGGGA